MGVKLTVRHMKKALNSQTQIQIPTNFKNQIANFKKQDGIGRCLDLW